jgi:predicted CXXCH cytochrome family protein
MRRLAALAAVGTLWLFLLAVPALADNGPHQAGIYTGTTTDSCAGCHRAHSATSVDILLTAQPGLCFACHGSGTVGAQTDVQDGTYYSDQITLHVAGTAASGALRGGGFAYALVASGSYTGSLSSGTIGTQAPTATTSHHSVDESPQVIWGNAPLTTSSGVSYSATADYGAADVELTCGSCHDPHGNHQYRILKPAPNDSGIGQNTRASNWTSGGRVFVNDATSKTYTTTNYAVIDPNRTSTPNNFGNGSGENWNGGPNDNSLVAYSVATNNFYGSFTEVSGQWCATCHTRYNALHGSAGVDSGDAVFSYQHAVYKLINPAGTNTPDASAAEWVSATTSDIGGGTDAGTVVSVSGTVDTSGTTTHAPKCLSCHLAHGTDASMTSKVTNQFSPGVNFGTGSAQVQGTDANGTDNVALGSTLLRLNNRGVCESCHNK